MYPAGSLVTVKFSGEVKGILTTDDAAQQISEALQNGGYSIRSITISTPSLWNAVTLAWVHYAYTGTIVFSARWEMDDDELTNAVTNAVLSVTGLTPTGFDVSGGATAADATPGGTPAPTLSGAISAIGDSLTNVGIGVLVLVALLVALLVFRPDVGRLALA